MNASAPVRPELCVVYARILKEMVQIAGHGLFDWGAFAVTCRDQGETELSRMAAAAARFTAEIQAIVEVDDG